jgi:hypothetical protein
VRHSDIRSDYGAPWRLAADQARSGEMLQGERGGPTISLNEATSYCCHAATRIFYTCTTAAGRDRRRDNSGKRTGPLTQSRRSLWPHSEPLRKKR